ncbi:MAG: hypothetical protein C5B58_03580 [Acidobacteria bacterium]|nr:MAG: hypothetical protein C5B58_03580 [Acidobacteriota bacterium]
MHPSKELPRRSRSAARLDRPSASYAVTTKLIELGYLQPKERYRARAIEKALSKLRNDLIRAGIVLRR